MGIIIGIAGGVGAGKTTFALSLAAELGGISTSFGDYIRSEAIRQSLGTSREELQSIGESLIQSIGYEALLRRVLTQAGWNGMGILVLEGVRHLQIANLLRKTMPDHHVVLVFLALDGDARTRRVSEREAMNIDIGTVDAHPTEKEVPLLRDVADLVLDGQLPIPILVMSTRQKLAAMGHV